MSSPDAPASRAAMADWLRALTRTAGLVPSGSRTLAAIIDERAAASPHAPALIGEADSLSYGELAILSRRCAAWALAQGLRAGDRVALMAANAPAIPAIWIGLGRVGIVTALVNTNMLGAGLRHSLALAGARHLIADAAFAERVADWTAEPARGRRVWIRGGGPAASFEAALAGCEPLSEHPAPLGRDPALLLFTSGTTGLPKAAFISHYRIVMWSEWFAGLIDATPDDRLYDCLPMYHSVGGVVAVGAMLAGGGAVIVRERFSASRFWPDVVASRATIFQYIGELCRFLDAAPAQPEERAHRLRLACGNGLREDVWRRFTARFAVPRVIEFYAATEGSFSLFNLEGRPGSLGRVPGFLAHRSPVALVRYDADGERPARGADGFCLRCGPDEPGEAIGRIESEGAGLATRFEGYTSDEDTRAKVLRDVFAIGDAWFRTGDLMRRDAQGFYWFVDRIGDTFRWRGENVATTEVADVLERAPGVAAACVYGVEVPGAEGRAGMAALVTGPDFDLVRLYAHLAVELPFYARPLFLRLVGGLDLTGTFRQQKAGLRSQGYDAAAGSEVLIDGGEGYLPLDGQWRRRLKAGVLRFQSIGPDIGSGSMP